MQTLYRFKGSTETLYGLSTIDDRNIGDVYKCDEDLNNYCWNGIEWINLGQDTDFSNISDKIDIFEKQIEENGIIVSPTEPTGLDRKKVWMQNNEIDNKIYVKNDNDVYETFMKEDVTEGIQISNNTRNHTNQYLKIFSVDMQNENYKANSVLFKLSCVQGGLFDIVCNLQIHREDTDKGITGVELKVINRVCDTIDLCNNLVAVLENDNIVSLYMKITSSTNTPKIKILSYQKYKNEELTIYSEQYLDSLPSGTQYKIIYNDDIYYNKGDEINFNGYLIHGNVTGDAKVLQLMMYTPKSLKYITSINFTDLNMVLRGINGYLEGNASGVQISGNSNYTISNIKKVSDNAIYFDVARKTAFSVTNNTPVMTLTISGKVTLN